jgi:hypothetical protein
MLGAIAASLLVASAWVKPQRAHAARELGAKTTSSSLHRTSGSRGCKLSTPARRIAPMVVSGGPLSVASFGTQIAIGASVNQTTGVGLVLSAKDLSVLKTEWVTDPVSLSAVVPTTNDVFSVDRWTHAVPGTSAFSVGMTPRGFSRIGQSDQSAIWPGPARDAITRPAIARLPKNGWAIAFRQGDGAGSVRLGTIDAQGKATSQLASYASRAEHASAPSLAVGQDRLALTFAERGVGGAWWVVVGSSRLGSLPSTDQLRRIAEDAEAPAIAALSDGRWLLVWAAAGKLEARVLDPELGRVARSLTLGEIGGGTLPSIAIWSNGSRVAVAYTKDVGNWRGELWAAGLDCDG